MHPRVERRFKSFQTPPKGNASLDHQRHPLPSSGCRRIFCRFRPFRDVADPCVRAKDLRRRGGAMEQQTKAALIGAASLAALAGLATKLKRSQATDWERTLETISKVAQKTAPLA